jgi:hypothetical protein
MSGTKYLFRPLGGTKCFSGAGTIVVEDYYDDVKQTSEPMIILGKNKYNETMDFGGYCDKCDPTLAATAHHELREESRNLFHINPRHFTEYKDVLVSNKTHAHYRIHVLKINGMRRDEFQFNKQLIDDACESGSSKTHGEWLESVDLVRIPLRSINFDQLGRRDVAKIDLKDIDGNEIKLCGRTRMMLFNTYDLIAKIIGSKPIASRSDLITYQIQSDGQAETATDSITNGTKCFFVK